MNINIQWTQFSNLRMYLIPPLRKGCDLRSINGLRWYFPLWIWTLRRRGNCCLGGWLLEDNLYDISVEIKAFCPSPSPLLSLSLSLSLSCCSLSNHSSSMSWSGIASRGKGCLGNQGMLSIMLANRQGGEGKGEPYSESPEIYLLP